jgi:hypothetical protein
MSGIPADKNAPPKKATERRVRKEGCGWSRISVNYYQCAAIAFYFMALLHISTCHSNYPSTFLML